MCDVATLSDFPDHEEHSTQPSVDMKIKISKHAKESLLNTVFSTSVFLNVSVVINFIFP